MTAPRIAAACLVMLAPLAAALGASPDGPAAAAPSGHTTISITVVGCDGCKVRPVQNDDNDISYLGRTRTAHGDPDTLTFVVPTGRTRKMEFWVVAPFDEFGNIPATSVVGFRGKAPGSPVGAGYASRPRPASGCWAGTQRAQVHLTMVVRQVRVPVPLIGPGTYTLAAAYFTKTLPALPYFDKARENALHSTDPSVCRTATWTVRRPDAAVTRRAGGCLPVSRSMPGCDLPAVGGADHLEDPAAITAVLDVDPGALVTGLAVDDWWLGP